MNTQQSLHSHHVGWRWHLVNGLLQYLCWVNPKAFVRGHMTNEWHLRFPQVDFVAVQPDSSCCTPLEELLQVLVVILDSLVLHITKPNRNKIVCNHLNSRRPSMSSCILR